MDPAEGAELDAARSAALAFAAHFDLSSEARRELAGQPLFGPVELEREGKPVRAYRWLGGGRGGRYLQVELEPGCAAVVHGSEAGRQLGPWRPSG